MPNFKNKIKKATTGATVIQGKGKSAAPSAPGELDSFKFKHTAEEADALIMDLIPTSVAADLSDSNWKIRLTALDELVSWLDGTISEVDSEIIVRFLARKGWSEKNFQVGVTQHSYDD